MDEKENSLINKKIKHLYKIVQQLSDDTVIKHLHEAIVFDSGMVPELLLYKNEKSWNIGHVVARYRSERLLRIYLDLLGHYPSVTRLVIAAQTKNTHATVGHFIARHHNSASFLFFLNFAKRFVKNDIGEFLAIKDKKGRHIGYSAVGSADKDQLSVYLKFIQQSVPGSIFELLSTKDITQNALVHKITKKMSPESILYFLEYISIYLGDELPKLLLVQNVQSLNLGHIFAARQDVKILKKYFEILSALSRDDLSEIVLSKTDAGLTFGNIIESGSSQETVNIYLRFIQQNIYNSKLNGTEVLEGCCLLECLERTPKEIACQLIIELLSSRKPFQEQFINELAYCWKEHLLSFIESLNDKDKIYYLKQAKSVDTNLGVFFRVKRGFSGLGTYERLFRLLDENKEQNTQKLSIQMT